MCENYLVSRVTADSIRALASFAFCLSQTSICRDDRPGVAQSVLVESLNALSRVALEDPQTGISQMLNFVKVVLDAKALAIAAAPTSPMAACRRLKRG